MHMRVIGFIPPIIGLENRFNTFRLGTALSKRLCPGEEVILLNEREKIAFGKAIIEKVDVGRLDEMCALHAKNNHLELGQSSEESAARLYAVLQKIYGPHIVTPTKKATVIYCRRTE